MPRLLVMLIVTFVETRYESSDSVAAWLPWQCGFGANGILKGKCRGYNGRRNCGFIGGSQTCF
jgi:hypothetical protein